jgi:hypothetical protein
VGGLKEGPQLVNLQVDNTHSDCMAWFVMHCLQCVCVLRMPAPPCDQALIQEQPNARWRYCVLFNRVDAALRTSGLVAERLICASVAARNKAP